MLKTCLSILQLVLFDFQYQMSLVENKLYNILEPFFRTCVHRIPWLVSLTDSLTQGKRYA